MKKILLVAALATLSMSAFAQKGERGPFLTNKAFDNWFISAGGGVNIYFGEADKTAKFGKRLAPALDVSLGKFFTPAVGARIQYAGLSAKGSSPSATAFTTGGKTSNGFPEKKFNVHFIHADFLWNISSAIGGYKPTRVWEFIPFAGAGLATAKKNNSAKHEFAIAGGLLNKIRIAKPLDINIEIRGMLVNQRFDLVSGGRKGEGMLSVTAGLTLRLGNKLFEKPQKVAPVDYSKYNDRIKLLENDLAASQARADKLAKDLAAKGTAAAPVAAKYVLPDVGVFFQIGKATLDKKEKANIRFIAEAIKKLPANQIVVLDGNADSKTGTKAGNQALSERRAKTVYDALVAEGVNPAQLKIVANGDTKEPFGSENPVLNRVLIVEH